MPSPHQRPRAVHEAPPLGRVPEVSTCICSPRPGACPFLAPAQGRAPSVRPARGRVLRPRAAPARGRHGRPAPAPLSWVSSFRSCSRKLSRRSPGSHGGSVCRGPDLRHCHGPRAQQGRARHRGTAARLPPGGREGVPLVGDP